MVTISTDVEYIISDGLGELTIDSSHLRNIINVGSPEIKANIRTIGKNPFFHKIEAISNSRYDFNRASYLLGARGYTVHRNHQLGQIDLEVTPSNAVRPPSFEDFISNELEQCFSNIESETTEAFAQADRSYFNSMLAEWSTEKNDLPESDLCDLRIEEVSDVVFAEWSTEKNDLPESDLCDLRIEERVICESIDMRTRSAMNNVEMAYAKVIYQYNEHILTSGSYDLAKNCLKIFKEMQDQKAVELWDMVIAMVSIPQGYQDDVVVARCSLQMQTLLIEHARKHLEDQYYEFIQKVVFGNLQHADLEPRPGEYFFIRSFLKLQCSKLPTALEHLVYLRNEAKSLITFAGMIPYNLPGDTNAKLIQLEVIMLT